MSAHPGIAAELFHAALGAGYDLSLLTMSPTERDIDHLVERMCNAERELYLCQRDLLEIRREGPRATRANSATGTLQLCRLNRRQAHRAASDMRARYARGTV